MGSTLLQFKRLVVATFLLFAPAAQAEVPELTPLNYKLRYDVEWNGISLGRVRVEVKENFLTYTMSVDTKISSALGFLKKEQTLVTVDGAKRGGHYVHTNYRSRTPVNEQGTDMRYDGDGNLTFRKRLKEDDPNWRAQVPWDEANKATDPVTAAYIVRQNIRDGMEIGNRVTTVKLYDGARLADFMFKVVSPARVEAMDKFYDAINVVVSRAPILGYTPKELKKFKEGDPTVHVYFSADERMLPLKAEMQVTLGKLSATLVELEGLK